MYKIFFIMVIFCGCYLLEAKEDNSKLKEDEYIQADDNIFTDGCNPSPYTPGCFGHNLKRNKSKLSKKDKAKLAKKIEDNRVKDEIELTNKLQNELNKTNESSKNKN